MLPFRLQRGASYPESYPVDCPAAQPFTRCQTAFAAALECQAQRAQFIGQGQRRKLRRNRQLAQRLFSANQVIRNGFNFSVLRRKARSIRQAPPLSSLRALPFDIR